jgi:hypothetical protein
VSFKIIEKIAKTQSKVIKEGDQGYQNVQEKLLKKIDNNMNNLSLTKVVKVVSHCNLGFNTNLR